MSTTLHNICILDFAKAGHIVSKHILKGGLKIYKHTHTHTHKTTIKKYKSFLAVNIYKKDLDEFLIISGAVSTMHSS